jgi:hypothetical protein
MLPPVSLPMAKATRPAAVAEPGPALEPDEPSSSSHGIHRLAAKPDVVERQRAQTELGDQHSAGILQALDDDRILLRHTVAIGLGAPGRRNVRGVEQVLHAIWNSMQRAAIFAGCDFGVGLPGLLHREVAGQVMTQCSWGSYSRNRFR